MTTAGKAANRLIKEKSPYLLQHANNPVDWYPWGEEAFEKAKREDKPIFLSIGYSTCHWCHVMERESFEDDEVAQALNDSFVSIKVDREERPDVDSIYMGVCQLLTGSGGWPLTIFMDADKTPFFAGTYFPKTGRAGLPGFLDILHRTDTLWTQERQDLKKSAQTIARAMQPPPERERELSPWVVTQAYKRLSAQFDAENGGFGLEPKFPSPHSLFFLLRYHHSTGDAKALSMVQTTLDAMLKGGLYDHIGFGFCRYSTDRQWLVPHFEKMLYDNALLAMAFTEAYHVTRQPRYEKTVRDIFLYLLRDMRAANGGFYAAEDADSEGLEGKYYLWQPEEVSQVLGAEDGHRFCQHYDITQKGNFEGYSIPNRIKTGWDGDDAFDRQCIDALLSHRQQRLRPARDTKILTSWNGLMLAALSMAGRVFGESSYLLEARELAAFLWTTMRVDGRLKSRLCDGEVRFNAYSEDYACLTWGLLELYAATLDDAWLEQAVVLAGECIGHCWDKTGAGCFVSAHDSEPMIARIKEFFDGALPSANAVMTHNFIRLSRLTGQPVYEEMAWGALRSHAEDIEAAPEAHLFSVLAAWLGRQTAREVILTAPSEDLSQPMRALLDARFIPAVSTMLVTPAHTKLAAIAPFTTHYKPKEDICLAYVCKQFACKAPVDNPEALASLLE